MSIDLYKIFISILYECEIYMKFFFLYSDQMTFLIKVLDDKSFTYFQFEKMRKPPVDWDSQFCFSLVCCYDIMKPIKTA